MPVPPTSGATTRGFVVRECLNRVIGLNRARGNRLRRAAQQSRWRDRASCREIEGVRQPHSKTGASPITDQAISPLHRRMIEDMAIRKLAAPATSTAV